MGDLAQKFEQLSFIVNTLKVNRKDNREKLETIEKLATIYLALVLLVMLLSQLLI